MRTQHRSDRPTPLASVEEAAAIFGMSRATLYRQIERGQLPLPIYLLGRRMRIPRLQLERFLRGKLSPDGPGGLAA